MPAPIPSVIIGIVRPLLVLNKYLRAEVRFTFYGKCINFKKKLPKYDVVVFCRSCEQDDLIKLYQAKRAKKFIVYDIDDNFFAISLNTPVGVYHRHFTRLLIVEQFLQNADLVRVYSKEMFEIASKYNENVLLVKSYFDSSLVRGLVINNRSSMVKIAYPTGRLDDPDLNKILVTTLNTILKNNDNVELHFWGKKPAGISDHHIVVHKPIMNYEKFVKYFFRLGIDIGLAPIINDQFHRSKSNNKYREFGGAKVSGIYSNVTPYNDCIQDGVNGLLVDNTVQSWVNGLQRLINDPNLRIKISENSNIDVLMNYSFENTVNVWDSIISNVKTVSVCEKSIERSLFKVALIYIGSSKDEGYITSLLSYRSNNFSNVNVYKFNSYNDFLLDVINPDQYDIVSHVFDRGIIDSLFTPFSGCYIVLDLVNQDDVIKNFNADSYKKFEGTVFVGSNNLSDAKNIFKNANIIEILGKAESDLFTHLNYLPQEYLRLYFQFISKFDFVHISTGIGFKISRKYKIFRSRIKSVLVALTYSLKPIMRRS